MVGPDQAGAAQADDVFVFPASFAQQRLWFLDQFDPGSPFYNIATPVRLSGPLDLPAFERTINEIVRRHESLRTTFAVMDGRPVQVVSPCLTLEVPVNDLSRLPEPEREAEALRLAAEDARRPFNLSTGPLLRAGLIRLGETDHAVTLTMHHIVSDGWSMGVLVSEIAALYHAFSRGRPSPLPDLPIQYADFSEWQREYMKGALLERQLAYWKRRLGGDVPVLKLPADRPRPAVQSSRGGNARIEIPAEVLGPLRELTRKEGATLFMTLLAAFQVLLARYTGQEDVTVGTPVANRTRKELEGLIGCFINTLVIRGDLSGNPPFHEMLGRTRESALGAYANQDVPFEMLVDALQPDRAMSYSPLFQVMLILQNTPSRVQELPGLSIRRIEAELGTSTFDLTLSIAEGPQALDVSAEYSTDLFDRATIERLLRHYRCLLSSIARDPGQRILDLPLMEESEQRQVLAGWNRTERAYSRERDVHQLIEDWAARTPEAVAVVCGGRRLSYAELDRRAGDLAARLGELGAGAESIVAVRMERSVEMIVATLAVLKAGAAYLPIDPSYPAERQAYMLSDSGAGLLVDSEGVRPIRNRPAGRRAVPRNLAYVIYTSGSTGQSKGVLVERRSLLNAYRAWEDEYALKETSAHLQMASFSFDVFSGDFVRALCSGRKLVICPREWLLDPPRLCGLMLEEQVDCAEFVPAVLRGLAEHLIASGRRLDFMRLLICGSDSWYAGEYRKFLQLCGPRTRLINSFGLTEATIDSSYFEASREWSPASAEQPVPIGRPFPNTRLYIVDSRLRPVPVGVPGELLAGGEGLARGYLNRPDLTAERYIPDPFGGVPGERLYRTGDLARFLPDGNIELLGRSDYQLKIRGFRVEPGEIESVLGQHPGIEQAVVLAREHRAGDRRLVAYLVPAGDTQPAPADLRRFLLERMPEYMAPSAYTFVENLPLTPNGKIDRQALPEPDWSRRESEREYVAPRTPVEEALADIWAEVLGVARAGVNDNFFELGGHSLLATQAISRVRQVLEVELPLRSIFESPTVGTLAEHVEAARREAAGPAAPPIRRAARDGELPLSFAQQRLWFLDQLEPGSAFYNLPEFHRITGPLHVAALERALNEVVRRHEILRTTFQAADGRPVQVIAPRFTLALPVTDLRGLREAEREAEAQRLAVEEARQPFDLSRGPLIRARLVRLADQDHLVLLVMHHIVSDAWSTRIAMQETAALYDAYSAGRASPLPEPALQYADFAAWQREWLQGQALEAELDYWKRRLAGVPPLLELPADRRRPAVQTFAGSYEQFTLPSGLTASLRELARREGVTLFMLLTAVFELLLHRYSGQEDFTIGTPIAGRNRAEVEPLIGFFINTLVLRANLSGDPTFRELLQRVRGTALGAYAHQDTPFELLVDALEPDRDMSRSPLFQVMFVLQNAQPPARQLRESRLTLTAAEAHPGTAKFDLTLFITEGDSELGGAFEYNTDLFDAATVRRMTGHFRRLLEAAAAAPGQKISALPLLPEAERERLLREWNATAVEPGGPCCAHQMFEAQAARRPDAAAARCGAEEISFAELNRRANRLARYLRSLGAARETLVGVRMDRSLDLLASLLGVLKAGAAYVPVDPGYPPQRQQYMLSDAQAAFLLTGEWLEEHRERIAAQSAENPENVSGRDDLAYVIYTSGSTGLPKGAMITHGGLANYLRWCLRAYPLDGGGGAPVYSSVAFDLTVTALFAPLAAGRPVMLIDEEPQVESLAAALRAGGGFSLIKITPAHLQLLGRQLQPAQARAATRAFIIGGENLLPEHIAFWQEHAPGTLLVNEYGPTETVVGCCVYTAGAGERFEDAAPIGRPIINTRLYILDRRGQPVPVGVTGELYIGGAGVARGYLRQPALTAERFIPDAFSGIAGARLYRTGDLARYRPDGNIECLGRVDHQVKVRGFRVELGEIESVLGQHEAVREAAVEMRGGRLAAYLVPRGEESPPAAVLRAFLAERLPEYMIPAAFVALPALPLTPNGKLDRRALPEPGAERPELARAYAPPRTPVEEALAEIWAGLLKLERVGIHDTFFELGGHSLLATRLVSRVREALGVELPLRTVFETPTVAGLARSIEGTARAQLPPIEPVDRSAPLPLSFAQQRLWFLDQLEPGSAAYNIPAAARLRGWLDAERLQAAVNEIVRRHESLRTTFQEMDGDPVQVIAPELHVALAAEPAASLEEAARLAAEEARRPFVLTEGPLFRARLLRLAGDDHVVIFVMHHIVSDGWSSGILMGEISALYAGGVLPPLPVQYADYAVWQRRRLEGETLERQLGYWSRQLSGAVPLDLPADHPRPANPGYRGATESFTLEAAVIEGVRELSRRQGVTPFMTLVAAFKTLLARYTGQDDIAVGTPIANRGRAEIEPLIGFFVNTLVLRTGLAGNPSFLDLLKRVRETTLDAYANQDVPFEMVVEAVEPDRDLTRPPLFQAMFVMQNTPLDARELPGLRLEPLAAEAGVSTFDLTLSMNERGGVIEYSTELFDAATIRRMIAHFRSLLVAFTADPEQSVWRAPLLETAERRTLLEEWNRTDFEFPGPPTVHEMFEEWAGRAPDAPALVFEGQRLTYGELNARARRLAGELRDLGAGPETLVAISLPRSVEMIVSILGVLQAGCAYLPMDPDYPPERLAFMLEDSGAAVLIDRTGLQVRRAPSFAPAPLALRNLAYVIYTSGSTGRPKGVMLHHEGLANLVRAQTRGFGVGPDSRVLQFASFSFDASVSEIFMALTTGAALHLASREVLMSPPDLVRLMREEGITTVTLPPSLLAVLSPEELPGLSCLISAGEACSWEIVERWSPGRRLFNAYGPTECTIGPTFYPCGKTAARSRQVPIGRPIANTRTYILDRNLEPVPAGIPGEICVAGAGLARGYWNQPALTAERFLPDPYSPEPGGRLYRTGDLGRYLSGGVIEYLGRADDQVKVRGFRVELGEVESALAAMPGVEQALAVVRGGRLVGYYTGRSVENARARLAERLPEYMIPSAFVRLDAFPLTPNGKVNRRALPAPEGAVSGRYVAPRSQEEEIIAGIWASVLGVEKVGVTDSFFDLGGHSLLATQVVSRLRQAFQVDLPLRAIFEAPTVAGLAGRVRGGERLAAHPIERAPRSGPLPLSFAQQRLWFLDQLEPGTPLYNLPNAVRLQGPLDAARLEENLNEIVRRHESLRTTFATVEGKAAQVIAPRLSLRLEVFAAGGMPEALERAAEEARRPFDLSAGPLIRASLIRLGPQDHALLLTLHHIVADGWSMGVLTRELLALYAGADPPGEPAVQYADFAVWQRKWLEGGVLAAQLDYWKRRLAGLPPLLKLPTDRPRPKYQTYRGGVVGFELPKELARRVEALSRTGNATLFMTLLAAFQALLHGYSRQEDFAVGTPVANRSRPELEDVIGFFVNTLVLRADLSGDPTFRELLGRVRAAALEAYANQDAPFELVVDAVQPERSTSHSPLFQAVFVMQNIPVRAQQLGGLRVAPLEADAGISKFDLTLNMAGGAGGLTGVFEYNSDLFDAGTVEGMARRFEALLQAAAADPRTPLSSLPAGDDGRQRFVPADAPEERPKPGAGVYVAPRTGNERLLAGIWSRLLGAGRVGIHDNFFDLGGDSILAIQMIALAACEGLRVTPRQIFEFATLEALAGAAVAAVPPREEPAAEAGPAPLTPVQLAFLERHGDAPQHFNTSMLLEVGPGVDPRVLGEAGACLAAHHDALRLRFEKTAQGWRQFTADGTGSPLVVQDLSRVGRGERRRAIEEACAGLQRGFDISRGPLCRFGWLDLGRRRNARLLLVFHHLVADGFSWRVLLEDLQTACRQLARGERVQLPPKTTSYARWARSLAEYAAAGGPDKEIQYWRSVAEAGAAPLPLDFPGGENTYGATGAVTLQLTPAETASLLRLPARDVLLTALARALRRRTGSPRLLVETLGHGREEIAGGLDLSRTVGWFTAEYPVLLDLGGSEDAGRQFESVREQIAAIPNRGAGYGILRYLHPDPAIRAEFGRHPEPQVNFNYLGQFDQVGRGEALPIRLARESPGPEQDPGARRKALLYVVAVVSGGRLGVRWLYSGGLHRRSTVETLARDFTAESRGLIRRLAKGG
ncbi:MAG: amino acid adenylation domain-containing protein [Bryobacterales bacterium]|nr:amino acid adenylation domain-containing protein [Bryobacterales bacterium]